MNDDILERNYDVLSDHDTAACVAIIRQELHDFQQGRRYSSTQDHLIRIKTISKVCKHLLKKDITSLDGQVGSLIEMQEHGIVLADDLLSRAASWATTKTQRHLHGDIGRVVWLFGKATPDMNMIGYAHCQKAIDACLVQEWQYAAGRAIEAAFIAHRLAVMDPSWNEQVYRMAYLAFTHTDSEDVMRIAAEAQRDAAGPMLRSTPDVTWAGRLYDACLTSIAQGYVTEHGHVANELLFALGNLALMTRDQAWAEQWYDAAHDHACFVGSFEAHGQAADAAEYLFVTTNRPVHLEHKVDHLREKHRIARSPHARAMIARELGHTCIKIGGFYDRTKWLGRAINNFDEALKDFEPTDPCYVEVHNRRETLMISVAMHRYGWKRQSVEKYRALK